MHAGLTLTGLLTGENISQRTVTVAEPALG
jgi:hypothetical protein